MDFQTQHCLFKSIKNRSGHPVDLMGAEPLNDGMEANQESLFFSVHVISSDELIGFISLQLMSDYMSYEMALQLFNQNIEDQVIIEIFDEVIAFAFDMLKTPCIKTKVSSLNVGMVNLLHQVGFKLEEKFEHQGEVISLYLIKNHTLIQSTQMRQPSVVTAQILAFAKERSNIRAIAQSGLRLDRNAPIDLMRDYHFDLFILDKEIESYKMNQDWIQQFGETVITRMTDLAESSYLFQIQYQDGVRLDLQFVCLSHYLKTIYSDSLIKILLDKDGVIPPLDEPNDSSHYVEKPSYEQFYEVLNRLWWSQIEVAKAVYRDELPLAKGVYDGIMMPLITELLSWKIGLQYGWAVDIGREGRWIKRFLSENIYSEFIHLYTTKGYLSIWEKLFCIGPFANKIALEISRELNYPYSEQEVQRVTKFLHRINSLPDNATDFNR